jgi:hypothetical protein
MIDTYGFSGVCLDFEPLLPKYESINIEFAQKLRQRLGPDKQIFICGPLVVPSNSFLTVISQYVDFYISMDYDTGKNNANDYINLIVENVKKASEILKDTDMKLIPLAPGYYARSAYHDPAVENSKNHSDAPKIALAEGAVIYGSGIWWFKGAVDNGAEYDSFISNWVNTSPATIPISGTVLYQTSTIPATVKIYNSSGTEVATVGTAANGAYTLTIPVAPPDAPYKLVVTKPGYLSYTIKNLTLDDLPYVGPVDVRQLAGDVNGDGIVNAVDLTYLLSEFNRKPVNHQDADIDGNGIVNAADLTYLLAGFNKRAVIVGD